MNATGAFVPCRFGTRVSNCYHVPRCRHEAEGFGRYAPAPDLALLAEYREVKGTWERLVREHAPDHTPGQPWPPSVREAEAAYEAMKEAAGVQPGDPRCCQRYSRLHLPEVAWPGCRWYGVTS